MTLRRTRNGIGVQLCSTSNTIKTCTYMYNSCVQLAQRVEMKEKARKKKGGGRGRRTSRKKERKEEGEGEKKSETSDRHSFIFVRYLDQQIDRDEPVVEPFGVLLGRMLIVVVGPGGGW